MSPYLIETPKANWSNLLEAPPLYKQYFPSSVERFAGLFLGFIVLGSIILYMKKYRTYSGLRETRTELAANKEEVAEISAGIQTLASSPPTIPIYHNTSMPISKYEVQVLDSTLCVSHLAPSSQLPLPINPLATLAGMGDQFEELISEGCVLEFGAVIEDLSLDSVKPLTMDEYLTSRKDGDVWDFMK